MLKIEAIWRELLYQSIEERNIFLQTTDLASKYKLSLSTVHHALLPLSDLGIVKINKRSSEVRDIERLLMYWATRRNLKKDICYQTYCQMPVAEIETSLPATVFPGCYSAYKHIYNDIPADYDKIYYYSSDIEEIKKRFLPNKKLQSNLFIIKPDPYSLQYKTISLAQLFVDLWNLPDWYAKEFTESLLLKIKARTGL